MVSFTRQADGQIIVANDINELQVEIERISLPTPPFISTMDIEANIGAVALSANNAYCARIRVQPALSITKLSVFIGTASGNVDVGVYSSDGTTLTRLVSSGSTAAAGASAVQTITVASTALVPGFSYYLAVAPDNATVTIGRVAITSAIAALGKRVQAFTSGFPLPSTLTLSAGVNTSNCPFIFGEP
jgi:hypothetical protein